MKLVNYEGDLARGMLLRCKGKIPYENLVDFMLVEQPHGGEREYAMLVVTGYKAGLIFTILPPESKPTEENGCAVSLKWLKLNWAKWGYFDCPLEDVYVMEYVPVLPAL